MHIGSTSLGDTVGAPDGRAVGAADGAGDDVGESVLVAAPNAMQPVFDARFRPGRAHHAPTAARHASLPMRPAGPTHAAAVHGEPGTITLVENRSQQAISPALGLFVGSTYAHTS